MVKKLMVVFFGAFAAIIALVPMHGPSTREICGTTPERTALFLRISP